MVSDSPTVPLSEYCLRITKGTTPTTLGHSFVPKGINFIKSESISTDGQIDSSTFTFIDEETHQRLSRSILQESDVLFSMAGFYLGKTAVVPRSILPANTNQAVGIIRVDGSKADAKFIHYALSAPSVRDRVHRSVAQSAQPNFNLRDIGQLPIPNLGLREQRAIAHVLGTMDDKVELNRRMNETLEAMARAVFKSWFVDFDPVRAKAEGRQPFGMDTETAALFPDSLEDSPLGKIPKGWHALPLNEAFEINPPRSLKKGQRTTYLDMQNMPTKGHRPHGWVERAFVSGSRFSNGDTLVARITPCLENGKTAYVDFLKEGEVGWGSTEFIVFQPRVPLPPEYGYCLARTEKFREFAIQNMTGSSGRQRVPTDCFGGYSIVVPTEVIAKAFRAAVRPLFEKVKANTDEASTLATIRETLLPKLISGEIRVKG